MRTLLLLLAAVGLAEPVKVATFDVDATPPLGSAMAYDPVKRVDDPIAIGPNAPVVVIVDSVGVGVARGTHEIPARIDQAPSLLRLDAALPELQVWVGGQEAIGADDGRVVLVAGVADLGRRDGRQQQRLECRPQALVPARKAPRRERLQRVIAQNDPARPATVWSTNAVGSVPCLDARVR